VPITVRDATPADAPTIVEFNAALALESEGKRLDPALIGPGVRALLADATKGRYFIAEQDGRIVGQTMITYEWSDWRDGTFWWIQSVYVPVDSRRAGVFRTLHAYILALARATPGVCGLRLYVERGNERAKRTYEALGMDGGVYELLEQDFRAPPKESS